MNTKLIVEIGENHLGNWQLAKGLVREAAKAGGTYAKFQTYTADQFGKDHRWYEDFTKVQVSEEMHFELEQECKQAGIQFLSSSFTQKSTTFLVDKMGLTELKIASGRIPHLDLLQDINRRADQVKTVYVSTGGSTIDEIRTAIGCLDKIETLYLLHCASQYPTEDENVNLRMMLDLHREFPDHPFGYSDHSRGIEAVCSAVAMGATVIEKHFTYHVDIPGDDHEGAWTPASLAETASRLERVEKMLGSDKKGPIEGEMAALAALRADLAEVDFE